LERIAIHGPESSAAGVERVDGRSADRGLAAYRGTVAKTRSIARPPVEGDTCRSHSHTCEYETSCAGRRRVHLRKRTRRPAAGALPPWARS